VQYNAWKSADNKIGYILTNIWDRTCTVDVSLNLSEHGLTGPYFAYCVRNGKSYSLGVFSGMFNSSFSIDPREILLIIFSPYTTGQLQTTSLKVHCVSNNKKSISGVVLDLYNSTAKIESKSTNSTGWVKFDNLLIGHQYTLIAYQYGVQVAKYTLILSPDEVIDPFLCGIYDLHIKIISKDGKPVEGANVSLCLDGTFFKSMLSNSSGWVEFHNLPNSTFIYSVTYLGTSVEEGTFTLSPENQIKVITIRSITFAETPLGPVAISIGIAIAVVLSILFILKKRMRQYSRLLLSHNARYITPRM